MRRIATIAKGASALTQASITSNTLHFDLACFFLFLFPNHASLHKTLLNGSFVSSVTKLFSRCAKTETTIILGARLRLAHSELTDILGISSVNTITSLFLVHCSNLLYPVNLTL